jgi:hypothetical protein
MIRIGFVHLFGKLKLPNFLGFKVFSRSELMFDGDTKFTIFCNDLFDILGKLVIRINLLFDETVLLEVIVEHQPKMMLSYRLIRHRFYRLNAASI